MGHHRIVIGIAALLLAAGLIIGQDDGSDIQAMEVAWGYQVASSGKDAMFGIAIDAEGNYLATGRTSGALGGTNQGDCDAIVVKFDSDGAQQWIHQFGGSGHEEPIGVVVDDEGNCYVAGDTASGIFNNIMPQAGNRTGPDVFLVKYDSDGEQVWALRFGLAGRDYSYDMAAGPEGNIFVAGFTSSGLDGNHQGGDDAFVAKFNTDGELVWIRQIGTPKREIGFAVTVDGAGNCYLGGATAGSMDGEASGGLDLFIAKFDPDGEQLWVKQHGSSEQDLCADLAYDDENECLYAVGNTRGDLVQDAAGKRDGLVIQFDSDGNWLWGLQIATDGDDVVRSIVIDSQGCYVGGRSGGYLGGTSWNGTGMYLARIDIDGNLEWLHQFGPANTTFLGLAVDDDGSFAIIGHTQGNFIGPSQGGSDGFLAKLTHEIDEAE